MRFAVVLVVALGVVAASYAAADACIPLGNRDHELDPAYATDATPPSAPELTLMWYFASTREDTVACGSPTIEFRVSATDDRAPVDKLGYDVTILANSPFDGFHGRIVRAYGESLDSTYPPDTGDFEANFEVRVVDLNGNVGPPTVYSRFLDFPDDGCSASKTSPGWLCLAALALLRRRRR